MKKITSILSVSLAVTLLVSCSNDELASKESFQDVAVEQKGNLVLAFDPIEQDGASTRALRNNNFGQLTFQEGDIVNVYNDILRDYDYYTFQTDGFYYNSELSGDATPWVDAPKFAILRGATSQNVKGYIDRATRTTRVDVEIPHTLVYDANAEVANFDGNGHVGYACNLPMFGYASKSTEGNYMEISNLRYMVGLLKVSLNGAVGKATYLKLSNTAGKALSGSLTAQLYTNKDDRKQTKLGVMDEALTVYPEIYVDLTHIPSGAACIYLPVVAGLNGSTDGVKLEYTNDTTHSSATEATGWQAVPGVSFNGKVFGQHKIYECAYSF